MHYAIPHMVDNGLREENNLSSLDQKSTTTSFALSDCWQDIKKDEHLLAVIEIKILYWLNGITHYDHVRKGRRRHIAFLFQILFRS